MTRAVGRVVRTTAWLLTPVVVWAASFFGGWLGARSVSPGTGGLGRLIGGAVVGGGLGLVLWLWLLRLFGPRRPVAPSGNDDAHAAGG